MPKGYLRELAAAQSVQWDTAVSVATWRAEETRARLQGRLPNEQQMHSGSIFSAAVEAEIQFMLNSAVILLPSDRALRSSRMTVISAAKEAQEPPES